MITDVPAGQLSIGDLILADAGNMRVVDTRTVLATRTVCLVVATQGRERRIRCSAYASVTIYKG